MVNASTKLSSIKSHLNITWDDPDTDKKVTRLIEDGEIKLAHILGAKEVDFFAPGMERDLFFNYMSYAWNDCLNEFEQAYIREINRLRHKYEVKYARENSEV